MHPTALLNIKFWKFYEVSFVNLICLREKLLEGINVVLKAVPTRTTLPILECILIMAENDTVKLLCNNLEMGIETSQIESTVVNPGNIALDARMFAEIIRKLPDGNISINSNNNLTTIKGGRSEFKISSQNADEFPGLPDVEKSEVYKISSEDFKDMVRQTIFSVSQDESKPILMGELFEIRDGRINMVALDGFRISFKSIEAAENYKDASVVIPSKTLSDILRILSSTENEDIYVYFTDKHALFELESCKIVTRLIEGKFLNYVNIFTDDYKTILTTNRQDFLESVERAALICIDNKKNPVKFKIEDDKMIITSNTELDASYEELSVNMDGEPLEIAFNPKYLTDALRAIDSEEITIQFTTSLNPCIIKPTDETDAKYLILPLRLKD